ncbi:hypothetical protein BDV27DRAFT_120629 [Aspergillus caelatus]|uniref:Thiamine pyrophosphate enzyme TPP-binding domain-containing protein n=1 Tax=Aspergillus caelatus TaxID=61420 RepID=A0A5N7AKY2_9EURO|nr:uncharacterized protein BDV27DRAFT_120629 [Aspergillus caelatus]KAE8369649.1 hypothetical protein BDV27DRAFT_120629 [Aspergillus caelatus]
MLPTAQDAAMAERVHRTKGHTISKQTIVFEGDGSLQMIVQEVSTIIRHKLDTT